MPSADGSARTPLGPKAMLLEDSAHKLLGPIYNYVLKLKCFNLQSLLYIAIIIVPNQL